MTVLFCYDDSEACPFVVFVVNGL